MTNNNTEQTVYILQKDYCTPFGTIYSGVGKTFNEWKRLFPKLLPQDMDIKEWFKKEEPTPPTEVFQWTDELVKESVKFWMDKCSNVGYEESLIKFKQSKVKKEEPQRVVVGKMSCREEEVSGDMKWVLQFKTNSHIHYNKAPDLCNLMERHLNGELNNPEPKEQPKPDWEILEIYRPKDNSLHTTYKQDIVILYLENLHNTEFAPFKVKRLSDGEVFSVGDRIGWGIHINYETTLLGFKIQDGRLKFNDSERPEHCGWTDFLDAIKLHKKNPPKAEQLPIKVERFVPGICFREENNYVYGLSVSNEIPESKYEPIKTAIENELNDSGTKKFFWHENDRPKVEIGDFESFNRGYSMGYRDANKYNDKKYSESELLEAQKDAFNAAREKKQASTMMAGIEIEKYPTFTDYINTKKQ